MKLFGHARPKLFRMLVRFTPKGFQVRHRFEVRCI
jgi:hypothetical protein